MRFSIPTFALAASLALATLCSAQTASRKAEVDRIFSGFNTHTPGCAVGVAERGTVVLTAGYGMADLERNVAITPETVFESGSVAKQFTAAALMLLAQDGKISLDDPMRKYLPELADYGAPLTIRQVISHISGMREWRPIAAFGGAEEGTLVYTNRDLLQMAAQQRGLNFDPGTHYSYTNTGFNISTILIERALGNGKTFSAYTQEKIFGPLGMTETRWRENFRALIPRRALAYGPAGQGYVQQTPIENIIGAGGLLTTVGDLLKWNENFTHAKVGGAEFVKAQQTPAQLRDGRTISYAAGLTVTSTDGLREVSHSGATGGYRTWLGRYPDPGLSVAVLCNSAQAGAPRLGRETARLWTGGKAAAAASYTVDGGKMEALAGMYRKNRDNTVLELTWKNGRLATGDSGTELKSTAEGRFEFGGTEVRFEEQNGGPLRLWMRTPDDEVQYQRVEPARPSGSELAALAGEYESAETGSRLVVALASTGALTYRVGLNDPVSLRPTFRDGFVTAAGGSIFFLRDAGGKVTGLSAGESRVWDLRFSRVR
ncbi:MAG TPA: serine hydrolase domain-containing protein [Paludibaculum sp.]|jgi:CubicO group peptidase (beta-lactamase class C family)